MRLGRFKILHGFGITLFIAQMSGAFEAVHAQLPKYYLCAHTKQKIEKKKLCPCGCSKKLKSLAKEKLLSTDFSCADETDETVLPSFARWLFTDDQVAILPVQLKMALIKASPPLHSSHLSDIETPPPRAL